MGDDAAVAGDGLTDAGRAAVCSTAVEVVERAIDSLAAKLEEVEDREERRAVSLDMDRLSRTFRRLVLVQHKRSEVQPSLGLTAPMGEGEAVRVGEIARNLRCAELVSLTPAELAEFGRWYYGARKDGDHGPSPTE